MVPGAVDALYYGKPAVRCDAGAVVAYGTTGGDCVLYLLSNRVVGAHREQLAAWKTSVGTVRFTPANPLPGTVLESLIMQRLSELGLAGNGATDSA